MAAGAWYRAFVAAIVSLPSCVVAAGGLGVSDSRIIIEGGRTSAAIILTNETSLQYLTRVGIETLDGKKVENLVAVPPVAYSPPGRHVRFQVVVLAPEELPGDRESVFLFHSHSSPGNGDPDNALTVSLDNRLKVFFRPAGIQGSMVAAIEGLKWSFKDGVLEASNPSKFNVSLIGLGINGHYRTLKYCVIAPEQKVQFKPQKRYPSEVTVEWVAMDDFGSPLRMSTSIANE